MLVFRSIFKCYFCAVGFKEAISHSKFKYFSLSKGGTVKKGLHKNGGERDGVREDLKTTGEHNPRATKLKDARIAEAGDARPGCTRALRISRAPFVLGDVSLWIRTFVALRLVLVVGFYKL